MGKMIYLSGTYRDLKDQRAAVYRILRMLRHDPISMEDYVATDTYPLHKCLDDVASSDIYIGLIAWRYGYIPSRDNPEHLSITELEYRQAEKTARPSLIFLADENSPWPDEFKDSFSKEGEGGRQIAAFRAELEREHLVSYFSSPDQLASVVSVAVQQYSGSNDRSPAVRHFTTVRYIGSGVPMVILLGISALLLVSAGRLPIQVPMLNEIAMLAGVTSVGLGVFQYHVKHDPPNFVRNRDPLLKAIRHWVGNQLDATLSSGAHIKLDYLAIPDVVAGPYKATNYVSPTKKSLPKGTRLVDLYEETGGSILVLGGPGSGKTTLLLELARELLSRAEGDLHHPVPVVFKLSSWESRLAASGIPSLSEWLVHELENQFDVPRELAQGMIADNHLIPLLDGLDDVRSRADRETFAKAINAFHRMYPETPLVVTSRTVEYVDLAVKLRLLKAVEVLPLTDEQIQGYLNEVGESHAGLRDVLNTDAALREFASNPLTLAVLTQVSTNQPISLVSKGELGGDLPSLRSTLYDAYLDRMLTQEMNTGVSTESIRNWLGTLASGMLKHTDTVFLIENLQPSWLHSKADRLKYVLLDRLGGGIGAALVVGLVAGLSYGIGDTYRHDLSAGIADGLEEGARWGLVAGLVVGLLGRVNSGVNKPHTQRFALIRRSLLGATTFGLIGGVFAQLYLPLIYDWELFGVSVRLMLADVLFFALVGGIGSALLHGPSLRPRTISIAEGRRWSAWRGLPLGLAVGVAVSWISTYVYSMPPGDKRWLVFGLVYGLTVWVILGVVRSDIEPITQPNQRIRRAVRRVVTVGLALGLVSGIGGILGGFVAGNLYFGIVYGISSAALVAIFGAMVNGGFACQSHLALRLVLWRTGRFPWRLAEFLNDAARRVLLRRAGGGYTFLHRTFLEHIAGTSNMTRKNQKA